MGRLTNLNPIQEKDLPESVTRDSEYIAADTAHAVATDPHPQYLLLSEGDARYRQLSTQTFDPTSKAIALSSGAIKEATATTINKSGVEIRASDSVSAAYLSFHRPNAYGCHFGLDTNNLLSIGGWSFGSASCRIWHEAYGTPVWQAPSDPSVKENIRSIPSGLSFVLECRPVSFRYNKVIRGKDDYFGDKFQKDKIHYGFLADEFPLQDLVSLKNGYLGLDYIEVIPFLCRAVQELHEQLAVLREQVGSKLV